MASPTPNKGYTYPAHGGAVNAWDTPLNTNFDQIDLNVGGVYTLAVSTIAGVVFGSTSATFSSTVSTITLPSANAQNLSYVFTGTKTQNISLVFPGAVGGLYNIWNKSTDAFTITPVTTVAGSSGFAIPSGVNTLVSADKTNAKQADNFFTSLIGTSGTKLTYADGLNTYSGNSSFTGNNSHSGTEVFTGATTFSSAATFNNTVALNGAVTASSAMTSTFTRGIAANNTAKAFAGFSCTGGVVSYTSSSEGNNISTITFVSSGQFTITFTTAISSRYAVLATGVSTIAAEQMLVGSATGKSTTGFTLTFYRPSDNTTRNPSPGSILVFGI